MFIDCMFTINGQRIEWSEGRIEICIVARWGGFFFFFVFYAHLELLVVRIHETLHAVQGEGIKLTAVRSPTART